MMTRFPPVAEQLELLRHGTAEIIDEDELAQKLEQARGSGRPLRVKWGVDPTAPDIHLGHTVVLRKMKQFQDLGHEVILLIGDFTGQVGDPSGRDQTRKQLEADSVEANARTYVEQVLKVLDPARTVVDRNSRWLANLTFSDVVGLASGFTVARLLEREDFSRRFEQETPIYLHEFFYPLMQGYDSVALNADVELGGTEQKFNILTARDIQRAFGQPPEVAVLMPILEGTDGVRRMSKSLGNYIGIDEPPAEMYGKVMSIPDTLMVRYFRLVTEVSPAAVDEIEQGLASGGAHPRDVKMRLAREIVGLYHGPAAAESAEAEFARVFQQGQLPTDIPARPVAVDALSDGRMRLSRLLLTLELVSSTSEGRRAITGGGVRIDGEKIVDPQAEVVVRDGMIVGVGKRNMAKVVLS